MSITIPLIAADGAKSTITVEVPPVVGGTGSTIIPADRLCVVNWQKAGMVTKGGIPNRTTIYTSLAPGNGVADDSARIQAAIDACPANQVVLLQAGTFIANIPIFLNKGITLRGAGAGVTFLKKGNGAPPRSTKIASGNIFRPQTTAFSGDGQPVVIFGQDEYSDVDSSTAVNLTTDGVKDSYSVTIANAAGFSVGQFVLLDELSGASWQPLVPPGAYYPAGSKLWAGDRIAYHMHLPHDYQDDSDNSNAAGPYDTTPGVPPASMSWFSRTDRIINEIKEIVGVSGNMITFSSPLTIGYRTSHSAQLTRYTGSGVHVQNIGLENMTLLGGGNGNIIMASAAYSWVKNVESTQWLGTGVYMANSFRIEVRDSYLHTASWADTGSGSYILAFANGTAESLVENNIIMDADKVMVARSCGAGCVVGYNYADDSWIEETNTPLDNNYVEVGLNASHQQGPHHVLFEGNYCHNYDNDWTHGGSVYMTILRNWLSGKRRDWPDDSTFGNVRCAGLGAGAWWHSFVGNVLGISGKMAGWALTDVAMSCDATGGNCTGNNSNWGGNNSGSSVWRLGYDQWTNNPDAKVLSTMIRDGNYDYLTNVIHWYNTPAGFTIPASLYLSGKPAFMGANPWPWVDPIAGKTYTLPAKARFEAGTPNKVS
jgi:hypothetical protein